MRNSATCTCIQGERGWRNNIITEFTATVRRRSETGNRRGPLCIYTKIIFFTRRKLRKNISFTNGSPDEFLFNKPRSYWRGAGFCLDNNKPSSSSEEEEEIRRARTANSAPSEPWLLPRVSSERVGATTATTTTVYSRGSSMKPAEVRSYSMN